MLFQIALEVKGRDDGLSYPSGGHEQIFIMAIDFPFSLQLVQDLLLVAVGTDAAFQVEISWDVLVQFRVQFLPAAFIFGVKSFKSGVVPVAFKRNGELVDNVKGLLLSHLDVPFKARSQGSIGEVGRADISRGKAGLPLKQVGLGVQAGVLGLVVDLDRRIGQLAENQDRLVVGGLGIGRGDHPQAVVFISAKSPQVAQQRPDRGPFDKRNQEVNLVGRGNLLFELAEHAGLVLAPGKEGILH